MSARTAHCSVDCDIGVFAQNRDVLVQRHRAGQGQAADRATAASARHIIKVSGTIGTMRRAWHHRWIAAWRRPFHAQVITTTAFHEHDIKRIDFTSRQISGAGAYATAPRLSDQQAGFIVAGNALNIGLIIRKALPRRAEIEIVLVIAVHRECVVARVLRNKVTGDPIGIAAITITAPTYINRMINLPLLVARGSRDFGGFYVLLGAANQATRIIGVIAVKLFKEQTIGQAGHRHIVQRNASHGRNI